MHKLSTEIHQTNLHFISLLALFNISFTENYASLRHDFSLFLSSKATYSWQAIRDEVRCTQGHRGMQSTTPQSKIRASVTRAHSPLGSESSRY